MKQCPQTPFHIGYYLVILPTNVNTHTNYMNLSIVKEHTKAQKAQQRRTIIQELPISSTLTGSLIRLKPYPASARTIRERRIIYSPQRGSTVIWGYINMDWCGLINQRLTQTRV